MKIRNISTTVVFVFFSLFLAIQGNAATRTIHAEWNPISMTDLAGFRLYQENSLACEISDPSATSIDCNVDIDSNLETWYTLTYYLIDGTESAHSAPIPYTFDSSLVACISANVVNGSAPLEVQFDAANSTGDIASYQWVFGDGGTTSQASPTHIFSTEGSYVVNLTVSDGDGNLSEDSLTINVTASTGTNTSPTAVITSSSAIGKAPFQVTLDASGSTDTDGQIVSYQWDLGDGNSAEGVQINHTYAIAGTYNPTVTVTDNGGLSDSASTPIIVESSSSTNTPPIADIKASATIGPPPLKVIFDAGNSSDVDGSVVSYYWDFGDGSTGSGKTTDHTFEQAGEYTIELIVVDDAGLISRPATLQVVVDEEYLENRAAIIHIINLLLLE